MKSIYLFLLFILLNTGTVFSQTLTNRSDDTTTPLDERLAVGKTLSIPYGPAPALNGGLARMGSLFFSTTDSLLYVYKGSEGWKVVGGITGSGTAGNLTKWTGVNTISNAIAGTDYAPVASPFFTGTVNMAVANVGGNPVVTSVSGVASINITGSAGYAGSAAYATQAQNSYNASTAAYAIQSQDSYNASTAAYAVQAQNSYTAGTATNWEKYNGEVVAQPSLLMTYNSGTGKWGDSDAPTIQNWLGLGANAYTSTSFAPLNSPVFTGNPLVPTAGPGDNSLSAASTAFVHNAISNATLGGEEGSYIQNGTSPQAASNFNISGNAVVGTAIGIGTGTTAISSRNKIDILTDLNNTQQVRIKNSNAGTIAEAIFRAENNQGKNMQFGITSSGYASYGSLTSGMSYAFSNAPGMIFMSDNPGGLIKFAAGGPNENMRLNTTGNFLINTTADDGTSKLQVNGNIKSSGTLSASNFTGASSGINTGDQDLSGYLTTASATGTYQPLLGYAAANNANVVHLSGDESVAGIKTFTDKIGIGTTNPGIYQLSVKGTIKTQAIKVDPSNWADYVFAKSYKLPALSDVEKFINEKQHLPDIPSDAEVKKNGIELGDMNALLLKKIEELTLYMIEKDKQLQKANKKIDALAEKVEQLLESKIPN